MFNTITSKNDDKKWAYRTLIIGPSGSGRTNALLNLIQNPNTKYKPYRQDLFVC